MPTRAISLASHLGALALALGGLSSACRGRLPPTEPRAVINETPAPRPLASPVSTPTASAETSSAGTSAHAIPPPAAGGGRMPGPADSSVR